MKFNSIIPSFVFFSIFSLSILLLNTHGASAINIGPTKGNKISGLDLFKQTYNQHIEDFGDLDRHEQSIKVDYKIVLTPYIPPFYEESKNKYGENDLYMISYTVTPETDYHKSTAYGSYYTDKDQIYIKKKGEMQALPGVKFSSFQYLSKDYILTNNSVLYKGEAIEGIDPKTTELIQVPRLQKYPYFPIISYYLRDKNYIYINGEKNTELDRDSFVSISSRYSIDKNDIYLSRKNTNLDYDSFEVFLQGGYAKDKNQVYHNGISCRNVDPSKTKFINHNHMIFDNQVYRGCWKPYTTGFDLKSYVILNQVYSRDKSNVYNGTYIISEADPDIFVTFKDSNALFKFAFDKNHVYNSGKIIPDLDVIDFKKFLQDSKVQAFSGVLITDMNSSNSFKLAKDFLLLESSSSISEESSSKQKPSRYDEMYKKVMTEKIKDAPQEKETGTEEQIQEIEKTEENEQLITSENDVKPSKKENVIIQKNQSEYYNIFFSTLKKYIPWILGIFLVTGIGILVKRRHATIKKNGK